jgi:hypothetical protein
MKALINIFSMIVILSSCSLDNSKIEKLEPGNGIYIVSGLESDLWEQVSSGYRESLKCESNEFYIDSMAGCVIGIDVDDQISRGFVVHRQFVDVAEGKKLYRLLISKPDGSPIEKG